MVQSHAGFPPGQGCQHELTAGDWHLRKHTAAHLHLPPGQSCLSVTCTCLCFCAFARNDSGWLNSSVQTSTHPHKIHFLYMHTHRNATTQVAYRNFSDRIQQVLSFSMILHLPELRPWPINDLGFADFAQTHLAYAGSSMYAFYTC